MSRRGMSLLSAMQAQNNLHLIQKLEMSLNLRLKSDVSHITAAHQALLSKSRWAGEREVLADEFTDGPAGADSSDLFKR